MTGQKETEMLRAAGKAGAAGLFGRLAGRFKRSGHYEPAKHYMRGPGPATLRMQVENADVGDCREASDGPSLADFKMQGTDRKKAGPAVARPALAKPDPELHCDTMSTRDRIIGAADALFYAGSIREVSVDRIAEAAGVTKKTFYYHFTSKDELIAAYLEARHAPTMERYHGWAGSDGPLGERIEQMFLRLADASEARSWKGCGFLRAAVELADTPGHPALTVARRHKTAFEAWLAEDIGLAGHPEPAALARMLMILLDGAIARMLTQRDPGYARDAGRAARLLLEHHHATEMYTD